jgi:hypothetical protein
MIRALAMKELRETAWIWLLAAAWIFVVAMDAMRIPLLPEWLRPVVSTEGEGFMIPFVSNQIAVGIGKALGVLGIALGIRQSAGELWTGTYPLLLHLPTSRRKSVGTKIAVGVALVWGLGAAALGALCAWAATPGTHASPFEWGMTEDAWRTWFAAPIVYLGSFATGLMPARWFGTRLFPLLSAVAATVVLLSAPWPTPLFLFLAAACGIAACYVIVIGHLVAVRDFS